MKQKENVLYAIHNKKPMIRENFIQGLNWDEERVLKTMNSLQENNLLKIKNNQVIIQVIIQNE